MFSKRILVGAALAATVAISLTACSASGTPAGDVDAATATSAEAFGGLDALIAAAKAEGQLNVIALPDNWASSGASAIA